MSTYFNFMEFFTHCKTDEIICALSSREYSEKLNRWFYIMNVLREHCDFPIKINSGFRDIFHNSIVGGVENSQHLVMEALDICPSNCPNSILKVRLEILLEVIKNYSHLFGQVIVYDTFIHVAFPNSRHKDFELFKK